MAHSLSPQRFQFEFRYPSFATRFLLRSTRSFSLNFARLRVNFMDISCSLKRPTNGSVISAFYACYAVCYFFSLQSKDELIGYAFEHHCLNMSKFTSVNIFFGDDNYIFNCYSLRRLIYIKCKHFL